MTKHAPENVEYSSMGGICPNWITWKDHNTSQQQLHFIRKNLH